MDLDFLPPPSKPEGSEEIRVLTAEEIQTVEPVFKATGNSLPDPTTSCFVGAVRDGKVLGFIVLQVKLHAEPMWIEEGHSDLFLPIAKAAESVIITRTGGAWVYLFAPAGRISQLAQSMGMQIEPYVVMSKLVVRDTPKPVVELMSDAPMETEAVQ